jgi:hypothetical protein
MEAAVTGEDSVMFQFCSVGNCMGPVRKHSQARLWPSELVPIALLFAHNRMLQPEADPQDRLLHIAQFAL